VAEAPALRRAWHGASDRPDEPAVAALRLQRAEVEAMLAFRHAEEGEAENLAWWRLQRLRAARIAVLREAERARLPALPPPPAHALSWWQGVKFRLKRLRVEDERPPRRFAARLSSSATPPAS
jgi:hypothetical protein